MHVSVCVCVRECVCGEGVCVCVWGGGLCCGFLGYNM